MLLERFYRLDQSRNSDTGGSGIGLSVAAAIADAHHGKLTAKCGQDHHFTIALRIRCMTNRQKEHFSDVTVDTKEESSDISQM